MTEFTPFFDGSNQLNYRKFVILRFHGVSKRKFVKCIILHIFVYWKFVKWQKRMIIDLLIRIINF